MRIANYRDDVLWAIAYKIGLNPAVELLDDTADAYASFVNAWTRRTYDATDYPEWTPTYQYSVPANHIIPYSATPIGVPKTPTPPIIGRTFKVYLVDPDTTDYKAIDYPPRLMPGGIHVGFEHGPFVWIKFIGACPQFTSKVWLSDQIYRKGELVYSPITGQCYKSRTNANVGKDPSFYLQRALGTTLTDQFIPDDPGQPAQSKSIIITFNQRKDGTPVPDPAAANSIFRVVLYGGPPTNGFGPTLVDQSYTVPAGGLPIATVMTNIRTLLLADPDVTGFTIVNNATTHEMTISNPSDFLPSATFALPSAGAAVLSLLIKQSAPYIAQIPPVPGQAQRTEVVITNDDVMAEACVYQITFIDPDGNEHPLFYQSSPLDSVQQILTGLANAVSAAVATDDFFQNFSAAINVASGTIVFGKKLEFATHAEVECDGSAWWERQELPFVLIDQVVRGAYADALKEEGQSDKGGSEEGSVPGEKQIRTDAILQPQYDALTDQAQPRSRYEVKT